MTTTNTSQIILLQRSLDMLMEMGTEVENMMTIARLVGLPHCHDYPKLFWDLLIEWLTAAVLQAVLSTPEAQKDPQLTVQEIC